MTTVISTDRGRPTITMLRLPASVSGSGEQGELHRGRYTVVPYVDAAPQEAIGLKGVRSLVLQHVGVEHVAETDAPSFLSQVEDRAALRLHSGQALIKL